MTAQKAMDTTKHPLVLYDGVCGLCNRSVQWILKHDRKEQFRFATLQGYLAKQWLDQVPSGAPESVVLVYRDQIYTTSAAAFKIARLLGGWPKGLAVFSVLPEKLTDAVYNWIARNRYKWFGKHDTCPMPDESVRDRFLDEY